VSNDGVIFSATDSDTENRVTTVDSYQELIGELEDRGDLLFGHDQRLVNVCEVVYSLSELESVGFVEADNEMFVSCEGFEGSSRGGLI